MSRETFDARWPRMMRKTTAARYCDMSEAAFEREINAGRLPFPITLGNREHWCRNALDKALDRLTGAEPVPEYRKQLQERYGKKAA